MPIWTASHSCAQASGFLWPERANFFIARRRKHQIKGLKRQLAEGHGRSQAALASRNNFTKARVNSTTGKEELQSDFGRGPPGCGGPGGYRWGSAPLCRGGWVPPPRGGGRAPRRRCAGGRPPRQGRPGTGKRILDLAGG